MGTIWLGFLMVYDLLSLLAINEFSCMLISKKALIALALLSLPLLDNNLQSKAFSVKMLSSDDSAL